MSGVAACQQRGVRWRACADAAAQAEWLAQQLAEHLRAAIATQGRVSLALSGGRSPRAFIRRLAACELDWSRVYLTLVDERWVPPQHADSNAGLLQACLAAHWAEINWLPLYRGDSPQADAQVVCADLQAWPALDLVVLGMGEDGHTASLFPDLPDWPALCRADSPQACVAIAATEQRQARLSLSGQVLQGVPRQLLAISGQAKLNTLQQACADPTTFPVGAFLKPPLEIVYSP